MAYPESIDQGYFSGSTVSGSGFISSAYNGSRTPRLGGSFLRQRASYLEPWSSSMEDLFASRYQAGSAIRRLGSRDRYNSSAAYPKRSSSWGSVGEDWLSSSSDSVIGNGFTSRFNNTSSSWLGSPDFYNRSMGFTLGSDFSSPMTEDFSAPVFKSTVRIPRLGSRDFYNRSMGLTSDSVLPGVTSRDWLASRFNYNGPTTLLGSRGSFYRTTALASDSLLPSVLANRSNSYKSSDEGRIRPLPEMSYMVDRNFRIAARGYDRVYDRVRTDAYGR